MRLELLAPICKRKKVTSAIFLPEASLPALDGGVDRLYTKSFFFLVGLNLSLIGAGTILTLPVLPQRWGGDVPGVDLIASLPDIQLFTIVSDTTWGAIRVTFRNASQGKTAEGNIHHRSACARPWVFSDHNKTDMNIKLGCSFQASPHQYKSLLWSTKSQRYQGKKTSIVVPIWVTFNLRDVLGAIAPSSFWTSDS